MSNDLLFEIGTEELPSGAVKPLADSLVEQVTKGLTNAGLSHGGVQTFATPRRLGFLIENLQEIQPDQKIVRRGPACNVSMNEKGEPLPALLGFAKSCGVSIDNLNTIKTDKGEWWVYESINGGAHARDLLPTIIQTAIAALPIAKPMRWGDGDDEFVRPVHWAILMLGEEFIPASFLGIKTNEFTHGHRFHHPQAIKIKSPKSYEILLNEACVVADFAKRRELIQKQVQNLAEKHGYHAIMPDNLLDEVTSIVEWPNALLAQFDASFLDVPSEALIAAMQVHQKCFALRDTHNKLVPKFITVCNIHSHNPEQVIAGNESVMRARLSDAAFFYRQDQKNTLSTHLEATERVVFQVKLGSLADKANRMQLLMEYLSKPMSLNVADARRAAQLSKCDLLTGMVGEFPELQGLMGYYYAVNDGEPESIAQALNEQYLPRFAADELPKSNLGLALSIADRMDTLVGIFAIGQKPTGVKDPFKLRRHALAVVRMLMTTSAVLPLSEIINQSVKIYGDRIPNAETAVNELKPFILERMNSYYNSLGVATDIVQAVRVLQDDWLFDFDHRVKALLYFMQLPEGVSLSAACKRVNNILQHADIDHKSVEEGLLNEPAEKALFSRIKDVEERVVDWYSAGKYVEILNELARLREPVDAFFEQVLVMVENKSIRANRLALLKRLQRLLQGVADISLISITVD